MNIIWFSTEIIASLVCSFSSNYQPVKQMLMLKPSFIDFRAFIPTFMTLSFCLLLIPSNMVLPIQSQRNPNNCKTRISYGIHDIHILWYVDSWTRWHRCPNLTLHVAMGWHSTRAYDIISYLTLTSSGKMPIEGVSWVCGHGDTFACIGTLWWDILGSSYLRVSVIIVQDLDKTWRQRWDGVS